MDDTSEESRATRRQVLGATAGALASGALPGRSTAQQASGPTVYVGSYDSNLYAVDVDSGEEEWAFTQPSDGVRSSPTVADGTVYVGSDDSNLYAVDAATGSQQWAFTQPSGWMNSSPTVADGTVYVGSVNSNLYAVNAMTGSQEWAFTQPSDWGYSSPTVAGGTVYVGSGDSNLYAVDAATGSQQWAFTQPSGGVYSSPTVSNGTVYVGSRDDTLYAVDAATGTQEWTFTQPSDKVDSSPTVVDGTVYVGSYDNTLYAVDAATGTREWVFTQPYADAESSPTVADGTVYVGSNGTFNNNYEDSALYAVDAATGSQQWVFTQPSNVVDSSPTVADGTVYVGSRDATLYAVDAATGTQEWVFIQPSRFVQSSPTVVTDPDDGDSIGSRVLLGTLGHHGERADQAPGPPPSLPIGFFELSIESVTNSTVGETLDVNVAVENTGEQSDTQTISLTVDGLGSDSTDVSLDDGDSTTEMLSLQTGDADAGEYTATISTDNDSAQQDVTVLAPAAFTVDIGETNDPVAGDPLEVTVAVENTGDETGTQTVELSAPSLGSDSVEVEELDGDESTTEMLSLSTDEEDTGEYTVTAQAGDDEATETVAVSEPAGDGSTGSPDDGSGSSDDDGSTSSDDSTDPTGDGDTDSPDDGSTSGDGGLGTTEMAAVGGGGGLALLFGAYALMRRVGDDSDDTGTDRPPTASNGSGTPRGNAGEPTSRQPPDSSPEDTIDDLLGDVVEALNSAEQPYDAGEYDRALARVEQAIATAEEARATARRDAPGRVPDTEAALDDATALRETIRVERDAREGAIEDLDTAEGALDDAAEALDGGRLDGAFDHLDNAQSALADAADAIEGYDLPSVAGRADNLDSRHADLRARAETRRDARQQATDALDSAEDALDSVAASLDSDAPREALDRLDGVGETLDTASESIEAHEFPALADRLATLEQRHERLRQAAEDALTRIPTTIPTTPRHSLSYDDIERGDPLGSGGNADVYHATTATDNGTVELALKEPRMSGTLTIETAERMMGEAETWQQLDDHDHIVGVVDYDAEPLPWIGMEYMDVGHLGECAGEMDLPQKLWTAVAVTRGVRHAHTRGIAHLDLKPANVLFRSVEDAWNVPKVADWGLSKHLLNHSKSIEGLSPHYAAPEQFAAEEYGSVDHVTDVYQLGAVFYELFTGRPPFEGQPFEVMKQIESAEPTPPSEIADVPTALDDILLRALATEKVERYEDVLLLRNNLQDLRESS